MSKTAAEPPSRLKLRVSSAAETQIRSGHPWLFSDSIREQNRTGQAGELAVIYDRQDRFLAIGLYDPESPIRARILHTGKPVTLDDAWWSARLAQALDRRKDLFDERTNGYRLINGESDGWPGLVLDRYNTTLVLKLYSPIWYPRLKDVLNWINARLAPERIVLRLSRNIRRNDPPRDGDVLLGQPLENSVVFEESGIHFEADVLRGQKTGFFLDQRENRRFVESFARGRDVLNAFSFSGGFSLYAARGSAKSVTDLDISAHALESARRNFALNKADPVIARCPHSSVQADTFEWLKGNVEHRFDLIILDPPSFAKREAERGGAIRAYERLTTLGLDHLKPGGVLVSCSCSAHVSSGEFFGAVRSAARNSGRRFQELQTTHHAPDHHAAFKEAEYLKGIYLRF